MWHGVPFACQRRPIVGVLRMCWLLPGSFDCFCCPHTSVYRPSIACLAGRADGVRRAPPPPPCVTFRRVAVSLRGPGQPPVLPFACCVGSMRFVGCCGLCSCWCCFRVRGAQSLVCWGCAGCGGCRLCVSGAQKLAYRGGVGCCGGRLMVFAAHAPPL